MRNFLRTLKYSWKYRARLIISVLCAIAAAALWGSNFTAIYPVLKILGSRQNLHQWVDQKLKTLQDEASRDSENIQKIRDYLEEDVKKGKYQWADPGLRKHEELYLSGKIAQIESRMDSTASRIYRYQQLKVYVIKHLPQDLFLTLAAILGLVVLAVAIKGFFEFWQEWLVGSVMNKTLYDLRNDFFRKTIQQDLRQIQESGSADLMTRFTNDTEQIGVGVKILYGKVIAEPLRALSCVVIAAMISWQLTVLFLIMTPVSLVLMAKTSRMMKKATRRVLDRMSSIYKILQETFQGLRVVKAFTMESYERRRFSEATRDYADRSMRVITIDALAGPLIEILGITAVSCALLAGAYLVLNEKTHLVIAGMSFRMSQSPIEIETLLNLFALLVGMADPIRKLSSVYTKIQNASAASDRVFQFMDKAPEVKPNASGPQLERHSKSIVFKDVCFSYHDGYPVLTNISLKVAAGETIALVGSNGCGKSTLLNLLPRFYDPNHGSILIDEIDLREANLRSLRKQIGIVTQDTILFDDTIFNNILYGNRQATKEEVIEASKKAFAHEFILKLSGGYETLAGEAGKSLSGGQKQRIALARAILRNPSILILDEHTSQCDPVSENLIHDVLKDFKKGRTVFIITHKMHAVEIADRIVVLDKGRIEAIGTHEQLIESSYTYQRLVDAHAVRRAA
ncbi:ABC transporter ATP-binding protein [Telmatocola sphagniphila]|uniref:ABC transporter ATP-binding protein n=1 Tax=Telmatocola sphagniphila TaxID=1123043 RepID=A0A8E6B8U1_9BACT|nr:ABC transporter ATP-binding protein [Telmatocola sphagniphila]QVL33399.1 ABC transporter ATP-binding protein [Telmatocola sphagniphila]